jgi:hypothetical protein
MAQALVGLPVPAETRIESQGRPYGICGDTVALGQVFSPSTSVFRCHYYVTGAPYWFIRHRRYILSVTDSIIK